MVDKKKEELKALLDASKSLPKPSPSFLKLAGTAAMMQSLAKVNSYDIGALMKTIDIGATRALIKALPKVPSFNQYETGIGSTIKALKEHQTFMRQIAPMAEHQKYFNVFDKYINSIASQHLQLEATRMPQLNILADIPRIGSALSLPRIVQYERLFNKIGSSNNLNIGQTIPAAFFKVSNSLGAQFKAMQTTGVLRFEPGLVDEIEKLLLSTLKTQEASLVEQRPANENTAEEVRALHRIDYSTAIIALLTLIWIVAMDLEERFTSGHKADQTQAELLEMHNSIEEVASQLDVIREERKIEAAREAAADAALIDHLESRESLEQIAKSKEEVSSAKILEILEEIAGLLEEQSTDKNELKETP